MNYVAGILIFIGISQFSAGAAHNGVGIKVGGALFIAAGLGIIIYRVTHPDVIVITSM